MLSISGSMMKLAERTVVAPLAPGELRRLVGMGEHYIALAGTITDPAYRKLWTIAIAEQRYDIMTAVRSG